MTTLVKPDDVWLLWTVILVGVALSIWLEQTYSWAAKLSGPVLALGIAMLLSSARIMPPEAAVYDIVSDKLVPLAVPLLLLRANVLHIWRSTGWLFLAFHLASLGTVVGAFAAAALLHHYVDGSPEIAGVMTASYIGGGVNFFAVVQSYKLSPSVTTPLLVADNFIMAGVFVALLLICGSRWARRWFPHPHTVGAVDSRELAAAHWRRKEISLFDIAASLAVAVTILACAYATSQAVRNALGDTAPGQLAGNLFVHITAWSTLVATVFHQWLKRLQGSEELGGYLLYLFLFVIGLPADIWLVIKQGPLLFVFCLIMAIMNMLFTYGLGRLFRLNLEECALAVNASIGGPTTAAAMAVSMGWSKLVLPALLAGLWGYTIGTAVGLMVGELLRQWLA